jgi:hypothetical protein
MLLDPLQALGRLGRRGLAGVEQVIDRRLHHVQRVADLMGDAARHLADGGQPLDALLAGQVLRLIGVLDDGQVQIQQQIEGEPCRRLVARIARPVPIQGLQQSPAQTGHRHVGIHLIETDFHVPPTDPPAPRDMVLVIGTGQQLLQPGVQGAFQSLDLFGSSRDRFPCFGMAFDLGIEILDQGTQVRLHHRGDAPNATGIRRRPAHVVLQLAITPVSILWFHGSTRAQRRQKSPRTIGDDP